MTYLAEFKNAMNNRNFPKFLQLWEEYCTSDQVDVEEFTELLQAIKNSEFAKSFGKLVETAVPLWQCIKEKNDSYNVLKLLIDLQNTNTPALAELSQQALKEKYSNDSQFNERLRLIGLRTRENFQGALANYDLLAHMDKNQFVYHTGGWGAGEIVDISSLRQQVTVEFEKVGGKKHFTFDNAFKALLPLHTNHFLVRRFAFADELEKEARDNPVEAVKLLLRDLGPKTAAEIKDELCELVIPEDDWVKWWQNARTKLKKDPLIEFPDSIKEPFKIRKSEITQEEQLHKAIQNNTEIDEVIQSTYNLLRDQPEMKKNKDISSKLRDRLSEQLKNPEITPSQELQIHLTLETHFGHQIDGKSVKDRILNQKNIEDLIHGIEIVALKKRAMTLVKEVREDWITILLNLLMSIKHSALRDYIVKELNQGESKEQFDKALENLLQHPERYPEAFIWYFQTVINEEDSSLPYSGKEGHCQIFDAFLVLLSKIESKPEYKELTKKMYMMLSGKRYELVRTIFQGASLDFVKEFLLLASKCHTLSDHDMKTLRSLAAVVHPSLGKDTPKERDIVEESVIWTTEEGLRKVQEKVKHIGTVEVVENAREIEAARALGDLRENSEYKFAQEKRARLQGQLKHLSDQIKHARVISKEDIDLDKVGVGNIVEVVDSQGNKSEYTILGPWEADPDNNVLSFQSQLAKTMRGCKKGESFQFKEEKLRVNKIGSFFDKR